MEYIDILDVLEVCSNFLEDPEDVNAIKDFDDCKKEIVIRPYLALKQKEDILGKVLRDIIVVDNDAHNFTSAVELSLTFNALLAYTNIESEIMETIKDPAFYDLLWASGMCDYILEYCEKDYRRLTDMVYHMLSYANMLTLSDQLAKLDTKSLSDLTEEFKRFRIETKPEALIALGNMALDNDPILKTIKDTVEGEAFNTVMGERKQEEKDGGEINGGSTGE